MSGWEPAEVTRYEYDEDGRLVSAVTEREPEWCRADVEALIAYLEMGRVGPHGQPMSEATSPLADPANPNRKWGYEIEVWTDFAARAESQFKKEYRERYGDDVNMDELKFIVKKVDRRDSGASASQMRSPSK